MPLSDAILNLLSTCRNELEIPAELKQSLLVESQLEEAKEGPCCALTVKETLQSLTPSESMKEVSLIDEMAALMKRVKADPPAFDLRVKDGSYTVTNYVDEDVFAKQGNEAGDGPRRAKQKIQTVQSLLVPMHQEQRKYQATKGRKGHYGRSEFGV
jgi:hypothetical protein